MQVLVSIIFYSLIFINGSCVVTKTVQPRIAATSDSVYAEYRFISPYKNGFESIVLKKDKTYNYVLENHIQHFSSAGKWEIRKDTLVLNSAVQKNDLPIIVKEDSIYNNAEYLQIDWVKNLQGDVMHDATIFINGDTSKSCMPVFENSCKIKKGDLKSLQIQLSNNVTSQSYTLKSTNTNHLTITVYLNYSLGMYIFFSNDKFIISGKKLYPTEQKLTDKTKVVRSKRYFLTQVR